MQTPCTTLRPSPLQCTGSYEFANQIKSGPASLGVLGLETIIVMLEYC